MSEAFLPASRDFHRVKLAAEAVVAVALAVLVVAALLDLRYAYWLVAFYSAAFLAWLLWYFLRPREPQRTNAPAPAGSRWR